LWHDSGNYVQDNARLVEKFQKGKMQDFWQSYGELWRDNRSPIVVICLTNQALDQFLEGVLKCTKKVIRVGSQSQSTLLEGKIFKLISISIC
jgi:anthranilate/para-aminobenzoate synthase component II